jgi:hypothetical protein
MLYFAASTLQHAFESEEAPRKAETSSDQKQKGPKNTERKTKQQQSYSEVLSIYNFTGMNATIEEGKNSLVKHRPLPRDSFFHGTGI